MQSPDDVGTVNELATTGIDPDATLLTKPGVSNTDVITNSTVINRLGNYELLGEIARGGMGVVYLARHAQLGRLAAVKLIRSAELAGQHEVRRFRLEAEAAAKLDHPGIVPVYEVGEQAGQHFLVMAYVEGQSLWQRVKEAPLEPLLAARLMQQVANAVQYAHSQGIIHRDLKPQNILLTKDDQPRVTDFGLAKNQATDSSLTASGDVLGTPSYMPPEQASGKLSQVGPLSDVYSLGATLYCLLTGRPPFQAASSLDTLMQVVEQDPVPPRQLNRSVPVDLDAVCLKCLQKDPSKRYASAAALAEDLERFCRSEPVSASVPNWSGKLLHAVRRNRDDVQLQTWSLMLAWIAVIVFLAEVGIQCSDRHGDVTPFLLVRGAQILAFTAVFVRFRHEFLSTQHPAVAQMRSLWIGFFVACHVDVVARVEHHFATSTSNLIEHYMTYPTFMVLSGFLFFALGRQYWGVCYLIGTIFFALALVLPWVSDWSPILFGITWGTTLGVISWRLRSLQIKDGADSGDMQRASTT